MTTLKKAFVAALKTLLRGRSFLQALFAFWISPTTILEQHANGTAALPATNVEQFLKEAERLFLGPIEADQLKWFSAKLKQQLRDELQTDAECMLPSFSHQLPSGKESGRFLALDVGGSTLRVALVALRSRDASGRESEIVRMDSFKITPEIKQLEGMSFFDWMASRIIEVIKEDVTQGPDSTTTIPMGMAWSFPVEQRSSRSGILLGMGKGFRATIGLRGQDLGEILKLACKKQGLDVELSAIVNDGSATLLSQAYVHEQTRFGLILGTGVNIAVHLPVSAIGRSKFGTRPESWFQSASHVIVNTELGMFGKSILPFTRWDKILNVSHPRPDFQPLEYFLSGYYLGEVVRLALVEAIETTNLLGGVVPPSLEKPYSLDTETLSMIEGDTSPTYETTLPYFSTVHPSTVKPTVADISAIRTLASLVSRRSAALLAAAVFSLWELRQEAQAEYIESMANTDGTKSRKPSIVADAEMEKTLPRTKVAFNGSVIERYPGYLFNCQQIINQLVETSGRPGTVDLVPALESSILGAAIALACNTKSEEGQ